MAFNTPQVSSNPYTFWMLKKHLSSKLVAVGQLRENHQDHCDLVMLELKRLLGCWVNSSLMPPTCTFVSCTYSQFYFFFHASTHTWISPPTFHLPSKPSLLLKTYSYLAKIPNSVLQGYSHSSLFEQWASITCVFTNAVVESLKQELQMQENCVHARMNNKYEDAVFPKEYHHFFHPYSSLER